MSRRRSGALLALAAASACLLWHGPGCMTPPALMPAQWVDGERSIALYPPGTERVEVEAGDGATLRGIFVPAGEGAPVVLHLLESAGSAATLKYHYYALCEGLVDLGYASLLIDYAGVGASSGSATPLHLARDAGAMWDEALRRAGGDPGRVVVRGISIGTLAAAHLLVRGARPAAAILIAPVRAESAVSRFAARRYNGLAGWLAAGLYRDVTGVDLVQTLARARVPLLVVAGSRDFFLDDAERSMLRDAVAAARGTWSEPDLGHVELALAGHEVLRAELSFLPPVPVEEPELDARVARLLAELEPEIAARFADPEARRRLRELVALKGASDPVTTAALACAGATGGDALLHAWRLRERPYPALPFETLVAAVSLDGPLGPLPLAWIERCGAPRHVLCLYGSSFAVEWSPELIAACVQAALRGDERIMESTTVSLGFESARIVVDPLALVRDLRAAGGSEEAVRASAALVLLKAHRFPARPAGAPAQPGVEVWDGGAWRPLDLDPPAPDPGAGVFWSKLPQALGRRASALSGPARGSGG